MKKQKWTDAELIEKSLNINNENIPQLNPEDLENYPHIKKIDPPFPPSPHSL